MHPFRRWAAAGSIIALALSASAAAFGTVADAATTHAAAPAAAPAFSKDIAGWQTFRWARYVKVGFKLPSNDACSTAFTTHSPDGDGQAITLGPAEESNAGVPLSAGAAATLGISFVPSLGGCGLLSASFAANVSGTTVAEPFSGNLQLNPGDSGWESLYNSGHFTEAIVVDTTNGTESDGQFHAAVTYKSGSVSAGFGPYTITGPTVKFWALKPLAVTTVTGHHGNLATFAPQAIVMNTTGAPGGTTEATPGAFWGGSNFSVFGR